MRQAARPSEIKRGERGARLLPRKAGGFARKAGWEGRHRRPAGSDAPRARRFWSLAPRLRRQPALEENPAGFGALSASARTRVFHRDGRGRRQDAGRRAHDRAGDREAEDPETPPCEDGLSAASTAAGASIGRSHRLQACPSPCGLEPPQRRTGRRRSRTLFRICQGLFSEKLMIRKVAPAAIRDLPTLGPHPDPGSRCARPG